GGTLRAFHGCGENLYARNRRIGVGIGYNGVGKNGAGIWPNLTSNVATDAPDGHLAARRKTSDGAGFVAHLLSGQRAPRSGPPTPFFGWRNSSGSNSTAQVGSYAAHSSQRQSQNGRSSRGIVAIWKGFQKLALTLSAVANSRGRWIVFGAPETVLDTDGIWEFP